MKRTTWFTRADRGARRANTDLDDYAIVPDSNGYRITSKPQLDCVQHALVNLLFDIFSLILSRMDGSADPLFIVSVPLALSTARAFLLHVQGPKTRFSIQQGCLLQCPTRAVPGASSSVPEMHG